MVRRRYKKARAMIDYQRPQPRPSGSSQTSGHGYVHKRKLTDAQMRTLRKNGKVVVSIKGVRKTVRPRNLVGRTIHWYIRSDTKKPALRDFVRDYKYPNTKHRYRTPYKKMEGD
jgi:hypothetical protein